tara:strand:+ start:575 stop:925 length:351 start_codon:yes stop_codon:yes gene_type:complete
MPLNKKGNEIMSSMKKTYGDKKGEQVFYASKNSNKIKDVEEKAKGGKVRKTSKSSKPKTKSKSRVNEAGNYTKPSMRKRLFNRIKAGTKGGKAGQWSARKAQLLASEYKKAGGGYK